MSKNNNAILLMSGITKQFNGVKVLDNAKLDVYHGEVHVLLGENGAGKSTLIKILSGAYKKEGGEITLDGVPLNITQPKEALDKGISVIYQEFNLVPHLPIYENIYLGKEFTKKGFINKKDAIENSKKYMDLIGLEVDPKRIVATLSVAQKQMVEIAKAISNNVKLLVLDEPTAAITDKETAKLFEIVRSLKQKGIGIIYISHRMSELFEIGDRCTVMRDGAYVSTVTLSETNVAELTKMMVGREVSFEKITNPHINKKEIVLKAQDICYKDLLKNINFNLYKSEILGVAGLVGAGRTELAKSIIGAYKSATGTVILNGEKINKPNISQSIKKGIVYLSEDRKDEGLVLMHSVMDNIALPNLKTFSRPFLNKTKIKNVSADYVKKLRIKTPSIFQLTKNLSGGNQQKVVIAKWLYSSANIYIFDEPTRGIDVGARDEIYNIMQDLIKNGASIIMISSDLVEVLKMCDRVMVMKEGEISATFDNDETLTQEKILSAALHQNGDDLK